MDDDKKTIMFPMRSQRSIMDAYPEHYGKWVLIKSFNDNTIVAYGKTIDDLTKDAEEKGCRVVGHRDDTDEEREKVGVTMYCPAPCESQIGISTTVNAEMVGSDCQMCPICKHRKVTK
jgi:hypothetical protein